MSEARAGQTRVETKGSVWLIDDVERRYCRFPKHEGPRENGWGGPDAGSLQDAVWHPLIAWEIDARERLLLTVPHAMKPDMVEIVVAPLATVVA